MKNNNGPCLHEHTCNTHLFTLLNKTRISHIQYDVKIAALAFLSMDAYEKQNSGETMLEEMKGL